MEPGGASKMVGKLVSGLIDGWIVASPSWTTRLISGMLIPPFLFLMFVPSQACLLLLIGLGKIAWFGGLETNGRFSVRTAYLLITEALSPPTDPIWRSIWKWSGPSKIKHFLWLASHKRLLTNEERGRRHLSNQVLCPRCSSQTESISHVLYDCGFALQVWRSVLPLAITARTVEGDFDSWWRRMLSDRDAAIKFGVTAWILWNARNKFIFEGLNQSVTTISEQCKFWFNLVLSSWKTNQLGREAPGLARQTQLIVWRPGDGGSTTMGGLLRDGNGRFLQAFSANIGDCSITRAELRAIVQGLRLAWSTGIRKVVVQSDSRAALAICRMAIRLINMPLWRWSSGSFARGIGRFPLFMFSAKLILRRIIWPIWVTLVV
ncbi:Putative ribonuclease H protein At1g65750 [Linum perenne]